MALIAIVTLVTMVAILLLVTLVSMVSIFAFVTMLALIALATTFNMDTMFCCTDDVSRVMTVNSDFVTLKASGNITNEQKRLVLTNGKEVYPHFKPCHSELEIGFQNLLPCTLRTAS